MINKKGFTLIETILYIGIISIVILGLYIGIINLINNNRSGYSIDKIHNDLLIKNFHEK